MMVLHRWWGLRDGDGVKVTTGMMRVIRVAWWRLRRWWGWGVCGVGGVVRRWWCSRRLENLVGNGGGAGGRKNGEVKELGD
ncbi:hypothetical protein Tco_1373757, partial [Tanacetum coccineum]